MNRNTGRCRLIPLTVPLALACAFPAQAAPTLAEVVVTAPTMDAPLTVTTDPRAPRQPVPAHDGADYLKNIAGFSVIRKGGTDGDPVFRGMAASRLGILLDGEMILGGCGNRMDPPTAYVFPEAFDRITVLKGPQTVKYGPGNSAGVVLFERSAKVRKGFESKVEASLLGGSFGRNDQVLRAELGNERYYGELTGTHSHSQDYKDGSGRRVHSYYDRWSISGAVGLTPDQDTRIELSFAKSDGQAAYADRSMDGTQFDRTNVGLKFEKKNLSPLVAKVEAQVYRNYVDHVMDNYSLRPLSGMRMLSNPDRETRGGRIATTLDLSPRSSLETGIDFQENDHTLRRTLTASRVADMRFQQWGMFGELSHELNAAHRLIGGARIDWTEAKDERSGRSTSGVSDKDTLKAAFLRWENAWNAATTLYAGVGHSERAPDYWERSKSPAATSSMMTGSASTFLIKPEKTNQLDTGVIYAAGPVKASLSAFYAKHQDFIQINTIRNGSYLTTGALNIDATTYGLEADASYQLTPFWKTWGTLAWTHGDNDTSGRPLSQIAPLEGRVGAGYDDKTWSAGALLRLVQGQKRLDPGNGNIVGQDIGASSGFAIVSLNAGYRPRKGTLLTAGVDNLFDKTYAEFISRSGAMVGGFTQTTRVNEPGRTFWLKANLAF
ncbi:TonB-dependent copper receptor [Zoogloea sp.]|uniref:TonB-dependent copper receptor n=1 Tax=Zoogloea sp. TaxID=49181 RepID=UPI002628D745|nr:TonB-dependent copper receptor [Zoogloea sp.]MDD3352303.1 TonB-dependent copper receptor [Zoogloea sp.]